MKLKPLFIAATSLLLATQASAHNRWLLPSHFNLSNDKGEWIMVDVTASNETFFVDKPMGAERMVITGPDGKRVRAGSLYKGHRKSVVDLQLTQSGTYQLQLAGTPSYFTRYEVKGEEKPKFMRNVNKQQRDARLPKDAINVETLEGYSNVLSFVTLNSPSVSFPLSKQGLELIPVTHPSDIAQGEPVEFKFAFNGEVKAGVNVEIIREGVRYRNDPEALELTSDKNGAIKFTPKQAGRYLLMADYQQDVSDYALADKVGGRVFLTFEAVLD
ncbi:DUF4198 domain-containing protein [Thalassotalea euphylliae]|uniref:DUF4198 domain-containing protein n=1 Tax=Thalassotalea euphylliae TaxID=1655234 RepID=A0A3E0TQW6_9GAMM|nr:DUF4198 domain-containing protein [Thalassotalea euphylliae]REL26904.1 DUF4198 domain-containing protein [Thalassotalea euphylliae]